MRSDHVKKIIVGNGGPRSPKIRTLMVHAWYLVSPSTSESRFPLSRLLQRNLFCRKLPPSSSSLFRRYPAAIIANSQKGTVTPLRGSLYSGSDSVGEAHGAGTGTGAAALGRRFGVRSVLAQDCLVRRHGLGGGRRPARRRGG